MESGSLSESEAAVMIRQILSALKHLHSLNIAHRDLKPENILFMKNENDEITVKLIDFGLSKLVKDGNLMMTKLGSPYYVSPEVLEGNYDKRCDLWAVGVLTFMMLAGSPPFYGNNEIEIFSKVRTIDYDFAEEDWKDRSKEVQTFIFKLLNPNPDKRLTAEEAIEHEWLKTARKDHTIPKSIIERLRKFRKPKKF